jgi:hypothetical protein
MTHKNRKRPATDSLLEISLATLRPSTFHGSMPSYPSLSTVTYYEPLAMQGIYEQRNTVGYSFPQIRLALCLLTTNATMRTRMLCSLNWRQVVIEVKSQWPKPVNEAVK